WFRNTWAWKANGAKPQLCATRAGIEAKHHELGPYQFHYDGQAELLFCENETNPRRHHGRAEAAGFFKDAFHEYIVGGTKAALNSQQTGTKAGVLHKRAVAAGQSAQIRLRLVGQAFQPASSGDFPVANPSGRKRSKEPDSSVNRQTGESALHPFTDFDEVFAQRIREADEFYGTLQQDIADPDARQVQRQALAGMIWSKQFFY